MRKRIAIFLILFVAGAVWAGMGLFEKAQGSDPQPSRKGVVVTDDIILPQEKDSYLEIRHIVLRGTNREIGRALGDIAQKWAGKKLSKYGSPLYAEANRKYLKTNYPILLERAKGVADSYGISPDDNTFVTSTLMYDAAPFACSGLYVPPSSSANGHVLAGHNMDFYLTSMREMIGMKAEAGEHKLFSRTFVMELYPDRGYSSLVIGSLDMLNGVQGGFNSKGLFVLIQVDRDGPKNTQFSPDSYGLTIYQLARLILDTCSTVEQAKIAILNNKLMADFDPQHLLVGDASGNSFIFETSANTFVPEFSDNGGKPQIMTNHAVFKNPDVNKFPAVPPGATYNTFYRYTQIYNFLKERSGKLSFDDVNEAMSRTYGSTNDSSEGAALPIPLRTLFAELYDVTDRTVLVKFYMKDGPPDAKTGKSSLIFSKPFVFKLKGSSD